MKEPSPIMLYVVPQPWMSEDTEIRSPLHSLAKTESQLEMGGLHRLCRRTVSLPEDCGWSLTCNQDKQVTPSRAGQFQGEHLAHCDLRREVLATCFTLVSCLAYSSTLKMEVTCSSETSVDFQRTTQRYIPKDRNIHNHRCEDFKSYILTEDFGGFLESLQANAGILLRLGQPRFLPNP
jgi:hypothetical protein